MKKYSLISLMLLGLSSTVFANAEVNEAWKDFSVNRDATINVYGLGAKTDRDEKSHAGLGIMFDSEAIKIKLEGTSDFIKLGTALKFNPFDSKLYIKVGGNYINQRMYAPDNTNTKVNQYSAALATGYMLREDFYIEVGGSYTDLSGKVFGDYEVKDEKTSLAYLEVAKRWETGIGTFDTTANAGEVFHEFVSDEFTYGLGVDYYPSSYSKIGYNYQNEKNNIVSSYSAQYSFLYAEYADNISMDTYQVTAGVKIAFDNLFDISTWKAPTNIKSHLSELHKFETMTFASNMSIQSNAGVQKTQAAIDRDNTPVTPPVTPPPAANNAPTGEIFSVDSGSDATETVDLTSHINDADGDSMTVTYVGSGVVSGDIVIDNANTGITGTNATITVSSGAGDGYIDYTVTDGTDTSVTYRITFTNLSGF